MKFRVDVQIFDHRSRSWVEMPQDIEAATGDEAAAMAHAAVKDLAQNGRLAIKGVHPVPQTDAPPNRGNLGEPPPRPPRMRPGPKPREFTAPQA